MPYPRAKVTGCSAVYHCVTRVVAGEFLLNDVAKERLRRMLWKQAAFAGVEIITYCILSNHFHILLRVPAEVRPDDPELLRRAQAYYGPRHPVALRLAEAMDKRGSLPGDLRDRLLKRMGDLSAFMKDLKQRFSIYFNRNHQRFGTLWAERYTSLLVEDAPPAIRTVAMYIDLNPVRAGLVKDPADYRFCGYAEAAADQPEARHGLLNAWLPPDEAARIVKQDGLAKAWDGVSGQYRRSLLLEGGLARRPGRAELEREFILGKLAKGDALEPGEALRLKVRYMTQGFALGSKAFVEEVFRAFRNRFGKKRRTGARPPRALKGALGSLKVARDLRKDPVS